jgi:hypothetical protein
LSVLSPNERFKALTVIEQYASITSLIHFQTGLDRLGWRVLPEHKWQQVRRLHERWASRWISVT